MRCPLGCKERPKLRALYSHITKSCSVKMNHDKLRTLYTHESSSAKTNRSMQGMPGKQSSADCVLERVDQAPTAVTRGYNSTMLLHDLMLCINTFESSGYSNIEQLASIPHPPVSHETGATGSPSITRT